MTIPSRRHSRMLSAGTTSLCAAWLRLRVHDLKTIRYNLHPVDWLAGPKVNMFSMGYQRSQLLEDIRYRLIREYTNELSLTRPPVKALDLIREDGPFDGQSLYVSTEMILQHETFCEHNPLRCGQAGIAVEHPSFVTHPTNDLRSGDPARQGRNQRKKNTPRRTQRLLRKQ